MNGYMQQGGNKETRKTQRPILEAEFTDYNPIKHDVFVERHNKALEKAHTEQYHLNRGIVSEFMDKCDSFNSRYNT